MAAKKPAAKATKAKKPVAKKAAPVKKSAPARKSAAAHGKPAAARSKPSSVAKPKAVAKPAAKSAVKPAAKPAVKSAAASSKPVKAATAAAAERVKTTPIALVPKATMSVSPVVSSRPLDSDQNSANDVDADDGLEPSTNLLAGPRNVKPYVARRGEQYMGKEQLDHFRRILETWKRDLMQEVDRTVLHMKDEAANFPDPNDRATQESEFSLELRTRDRERKLIRKIEEAIKRIDDGSYGYCNETGEEIGVKRLEARPVATLSLEAQERRERREKQYGDRDDRYR